MEHRTVLARKTCLHPSVVRESACAVKVLTTSCTVRVVTTVQLILRCALFETSEDVFHSRTFSQLQCGSGPQAQRGLV